MYLDVCTESPVVLRLWLLISASICWLFYVNLIHQILAQFEILQQAMQRAILCALGLLIYQGTSS